jgi:glycerol uptake facilitator-like aquaporin
MEPKGPAAYISEFVGTFFLVLRICGVVSSGAGRAVLTDVALVHTLVLMSLVYAIGSISGCHVNPAVTVALASIRKISGRDAGIYVACQVAGGVCAGLLVHAFFNLRGSVVNYGTPAVSDFAETLDYVNRVGTLAEQQGHHPDICFGWGKADVSVWTHKINGLTESDFVLAAKIDKL